MEGSITEITAEEYKVGLINSISKEYGAFRQNSKSPT